MGLVTRLLCMYNGYTSQTYDVCTLDEAAGTG